MGQKNPPHNEAKAFLQIAPEHWLSNDCVIQYEALSHTQHQVRDPLPLIWLNHLAWWFKYSSMTVMGWKMKNRYVGAAVVTLTETIWAHVRYLNPDSRTDWSHTGSQMWKMKANYCTHRLSDSMLLLLGMSTMWSIEKEGFSSLGKRSS